MEVNNTRKLYDALKSDGYTDLGDFSSFEGKLKDSGKREMLYDVLKKDGWQDLGDFSQFESKLGYAPINNENIKETDYVSQSSVNPPPISLRQEVDIPKSDQSEYVNPWDNSADYNFESLRKKGKIETATPPPPTEYEKDSSYMNTWAGDAIQKLNAGGADLGAGIFGVLDKAAKGLESATGGLIPRGGAFKDISDRFKADAEFSRARSNRYNGKDFTDLWKEGNYMGAIGDIALQGVESLPMSIGAMAATMAGAPAAGLAGIGSIVASQKYDDLDQNNPNMGEFAKVSNAILTGTAESLSEMLGAGVSKAWMSTLFKTLGKEKAQEAIKRGIMGKMQEFYKKFGMFFEPVNEGIEEVSSTLAENITDKITGADPERDLTDGVLQSFVYGMGGGAYFTGAGALAKGAQYVADKIGGKQAQQPITDSNVTDQGVDTPPQFTKSRFTEAEEEGRNMTDPDDIRTASKKMEETRLSLSGMVPGLASTIESYVDDGASEAQVMSLLDGVNADARPLAEDFYADYLRISGLQDRIGEEIDNEVETYVANNITPYVTTNSDGQSILTTATLSEGNEVRPVYVRSIEGDKAVISDNGQDRMISVKRLSDIVEQDAGHMRRTYEDQLLATRQSELDMTMNHNPKTQLPKPGLVIWNGDNAFILQEQDENGDWIAQPAALDKETGQVAPKAGSVPAMPITERDILALQDAMYDSQQANEVSPEDDSVASADAEITSAPPVEDAITKPTSEIEAEGTIDQIAQPSNVENPSMVMREDGTPDFVSSGTDMALDFLYDKYGDKMPRKIEVTRKSFDESLKKASDALEKAQEAYDDAPIGKEDKAEAALIKARQEYEAIKVEADFWANLDDDIKEASKKPGDVIAKEISVIGDPMSGEELAAMMLANGAIKLTRDSYKKETGAGNNETARMFGLFASPEKGGVNIERAGEILELADRENGTNFFDENDTNAGRDAIIEVLSSAHTRGDLIDYVKRNREAIAERERQAEYNAYAEWCEENYHMSPEEYEAYEESMARDFSEKQLTDEERGELDSQIVDEIQAIIDEQNEIDAILAQNKPIENENIEGNDESGGDGLREGGGEVLPREQLDQTGGTGEVEGRESAGPDIDRTDGATQEGSSRGLVPFVAPSPKENETPLDYAERIVEAKRLHEEELKVDTNPTEAQKEAGNYKKGHIKINGFDVTIEQPAGSVRSGKDASGKEWSQVMNNTYGYIRGTESVDGDHIDVFLGPDMNSDMVYVVDQVNTDGSFDEHKVMMGFSSLEDARSAYLSNYEEGWQGLGNITGVALDEFKKWIDSSIRKTKPFSDYKMTKENPNLSLRDIVESSGGHIVVGNPGLTVYKKEPVAKKTNGNKLVSEERYEELKKRMRAKLGSQMNMGIDPEILAIGTEMAVYHIEKGLRKFSDYSKAMIDDLGDAIRPYLKSFYNGARDLPEVGENGWDKDMTTYEDVRSFDVANFDKPVPDIMDAAETVVKETEIAGQASAAEKKIKNSRKKRTDNKDKPLPLYGNDLFTPNNIKYNEQGNSRADQGVGRKAREEDRGSERGGDRGGVHGSDVLDTERGRGIPISDSDKRPVVRNQNNFSFPEKGIELPSGDISKLKANIEAIETLKDVEDGQGKPTPEQQAKMSRYVGWGGLAEALNEGKYNARDNNWTKDRNWNDKYLRYYEKLKSLLSKEEFDSAVRSTTTSHYTPSEVVESLWGITEKLGFKGGNISEPAMGIGNIIGMMPRSISENSSISGFEIDSLSGRMAKALYPDANIKVQGYEKAFSPNSKDLVITNVPFGKNAPYDKVLDKQFRKKLGSSYNLHNYFILKGLLELKEGGLGVFVTSSATMDGADSKFREYVSGNGYDLVGAIRLPNDAFQKGAGTSVTADIVIFRKRKYGEPSNGIGFATTTQIGEGTYMEDGDKRSKPIMVNEYFSNHPDMMLGDMMTAYDAGSGGLYSGASQTLKAKPGADLSKELFNAIDNLPKNILSGVVETKGPEVVGDSTLKDGTITVQNGNVFVLDGESLKPIKANPTFVHNGKTRKIADAVNDYNDIKEKLTKGGIPSNQIAIVGNYEGERRNALFDKVRNGDVRILIGSTEKMGVGVNVQDRLFALHHIDAPIRPMDFEQRNGRILRQGNLYATWDKPVNIVTYGVKGTLDATAYDRLRIKQNFINQMMKGDISSRVMEEQDDSDPSGMTFSEMAATLSGDKTAQLLFVAQNKLKKLQNSKRSDLNSKSSMRDSISNSKLRIQEYNSRKDIMERNANIVKENFPDGVESVTVKGNTFSDGISNELTPIIDDYYDRYTLDRNTLPLKISLNGGKGEAIVHFNEGMMVYSLYLGKEKLVENRDFSGGRGLMASIDRQLGIPAKSVSDIAAKIKAEENKIAGLEEAVKKPWGKEDELNAAQAEVNDLQRQLVEKAKAEDIQLESTLDVDGTLVKEEGETRFRFMGVDTTNNQDNVSSIESSINDWSNKLNTPVRVIHDVDDINDTDENMLARKRDSKGWYDTSTGEIVIVSPNSTSVGDAQRTFLHEVVGHHGLRELFRDDFDTFLDNVYRNANEDIRKNIIDRTKGNPLNLREATEEYIAELAERGFDNKAERSLWEKIKDSFLDMLRKAGISLDFKLSDNDLRYILWRSYKNLEQGNLMDVAEDIVMRNRLGLNNINLNENGSIERDIEPEKGKQPSETKGTGRELETIEGVDENGNESERDHIDKPRGVENSIDGTENATDRNGRETDGQVDNDGDQLDGGDTGDRNGSVRDGIDGERTVIGRAGSENKGRGVGESVREKTDDFAFADKTIRFRENARNESVLFADNDIQVVEKQVGSAKDQYERTLSTSSYQFQEAFQDSMLGLKTLQDAVAKATRTRILDYENAYMAENALSSVNEAEFNAYRKAAFEPILKAMSRLEKMGSTIDEIRDYLITKHGIERNREMAVKRALSQNSETYKSLLDEYIGRRNEIRENGRSWEEQQSEMDRLAEEYGANLSDDFSGFTSMYPNEDNTGYDLDSARRYVLDYESRYDTSELSASVKRATDAILAKQRDSGLMSQNTFDSISDMYQFYVPLRGWEETTADEVYAYLTSESQTFNAPIKTVVGRKNKADDPIATIANMAESGIMQGNRNLMKQKFLTMVQNHKTDLVSVSEMWVRLDEASGEWIAVFPDIPSNANPEQVESIVESFNNRMEELSNEKGSNVRRSRDAIGIPYKILPKDLKEHQVIVKRAGKEYLLTINGNPRAAQALNGLTNPDNTKGWFGTVERYAGWLNRNLAANFTTRNPNFMVSNFLRDALYSNTTVWVKESPVYAWKFNKNFAMVNPINMYRLVKGYENGTLDMSYPLNKAYHDFVMRGGETGYTNLRDVEAKKKAIQKELQYSKQKVSIGKALKILGEWMDLFNKSVENCARFAAFLTSREMGRSMDKSIYDAKEISVNFNKKGAGSKFLNTEGQTKIGNASAFTSGLSRSMYVFWNAGVQGMYNFGRLAKDNPKKFLGLASSFYLLGTIMPMIAAAFGDDEDDDYYDLPEYVRRNNICFRNGGGNWITIPMPIELRAIYGLGEMSSGIVSGKEKYTDKKMAMKIAEQMSQVLPLDMMEGGGGFSAFVPSSVKPLIEAGDNKDWTGLPLYKDNDFNKGMPEWTKAFKSVDPAILAMTKYANELTGGDKYTTGTVNLNPAIIEHILDGYFGGIEATRSQMVKSAETAWGSRDFDWRNIPVGNRLIKSGDERTKKKAIDNAYYENLEEMDKIGQRLRGYRKELSNPQNDSFDMAEYQKKLNDLMMSDEYRRYIEFNNLNKLYQSMGEYLKKVDDERLEMELYDLKAMMNEIANGE